MPDRRLCPTALGLALATLVFGCSQGGVAPRAPAGFGDRQGVTVLPAGALPERVAGATVYVPIYSHIYTGDSARPFNLATTLYVRNTDPGRPVVVTAVTYHAGTGAAVRSYLKAPVRVDPLAAAEFFVPESDTTGGSAASFLVEWRAGEAVSEPAVEAVMVGTLMNQGVTLRTTGVSTSPAP